MGIELFKADHAVERKRRGHFRCFDDSSESLFKKGSQWCKSVFRVFSFRGMFETIDVADVSFQIAVCKVNQLPFIPLIPSERFGEGIE